MNASIEEMTRCVEQVQVAHRVCAAFYQRLLPTLDKIARDSDFSFWEWGPAETDRPCRSGTDPNSKWAWDMLPMFALQIRYRRFDAGPATAGDGAFSLRIYLEDSFRKERRPKGMGEVDAMELPQGSATVDVHLHRSTAPNDKTFEELWRDRKEPSDKHDKWEPCGEHLVTRTWRMGLAEFLLDPESVATRIKVSFNEPTT